MLNPLGQCTADDGDFVIELLEVADGIGGVRSRVFGELQIEQDETVDDEWPVLKFEHVHDSSANDSVQSALLPLKTMKACS